MKGLIFTYGMTAIGTIGAFVNPFLALLVYVCFAIVKPDAMWYWAVPSWNYSRVVALAMLLSWAMHGFGNWNFGQGRRIVFAYIGFWLWAMLAAVQAPNDSVAWRFIVDMSKIVLPMVAGLTMIDSVTRLKQLAWVIVLSQGYVALEMNLSFY